VIVYAAPEGDEVATYNRGTARLVGGEATVQLGETFKWVTNPDIGLTVHLTPVEDACVLYVVEKGTEEIKVRSRDGSDCAFDFLVYGLRIGFEESSIVQEKDKEAYIPFMGDHRELYRRRPDLQRFNSLERFKTMRRAAGEKSALDLSRAFALRDAIVEFNPSVHGVPRPPEFDELTRGDLGGGTEAQPLRGQDEERLQAVRAVRRDRRMPVPSDRDAMSSAEGDPVVYAPAAQSSSRRVVDLVEVSDAVELGDVLVIDRDNAGMMRRGFEGHDTAVIGVVSEYDSGVLGAASDALADEEVGAEAALRAEVALAGVVSCKVDATFGAIWPGDLLVSSPTPGHAMRTGSPLPGTIVGKALEPLQEGTGTIRVLVMLR
jgi:hypothetical protein